MPRSLLISLPMLLLLLAGCNNPSHPAELARVQGQVLLHGVPLTGGTIVFTPDAERGGAGQIATGVIDGEGRYTLTSGGRPGAVVGWHRVSIAGLAGSASGSTLPDRFHNPEQSGQSCDVQPGVVNAIDFRLE